MGRARVQPFSESVWKLCGEQHGLVTRAQLLELGLTVDAIVHRARNGRLHPVARGVYVVGRPGLSLEGRWMAAVLSCGADAALSHGSAAALWGIRPRPGPRTEVSVPGHVRRTRPGVIVYRRMLDSDERVERSGIPVTTVHRTLLDLGAKLRLETLERAITEADKLGLTDPDRLRGALDRYAGRPGVSALRRVLDRHTFALTDSELERYFLRVVRRAGLPLPVTGERLNGYKVDFHWPDLGLVVETDGLRYHRTPAQQARDRLRDQAHTAAGLTPLRFTYAQVRYQPAAVRSTLLAVARRLREAD